MKVMISACLLGVCCRYDGQGKEHPLVQQLAQRCELIPICPEQLGGLPTPRPSAERRGDGAFTQAGQDVTAEFLRGAKECGKLARQLGVAAAVLKERSPSCGSGEIYDGTFSEKLVEGDGITAQMLKNLGVAVYGESQMDILLRTLEP